MSTAEDDLALHRLHADFDAASLSPLWIQRGDLQPQVPSATARPYRWRWREIQPLVERAGELVPVGRGGERRAVAFANPGFGGTPFATPTLWAAVQYLGPDEVAPAHRHSQSAFRFVLEGEGVWTVVDGDAVAMRRGDLLLTPAWAWHEHHNPADSPMVWLDGLDLPLVARLDAGFFEFGADELTDRSTPRVSRAEGLWGHPGLRPIAAADRANSPLVAYRWNHTDAALRDQLELDDAGHSGAVGPGHAGVRFTNPTTGRDALVTMRIEMHRLRGGTTATFPRTVGSSVWQVFAGAGTVELEGHSVDVERGDVIAVPSWCRVGIGATVDLDLFAFGDAPVYEALGLTRREREHES